MYSQRLDYGDLLLSLMQREVRKAGSRPGSLTEAFHAAARDDRVLALCDRFERLMDSLSADPLTWDGDYA